MGDFLLWMAAFAGIIAGLAVLGVTGIREWRAEREVYFALRAQGCGCETWREGLHWPGCPVLGGLQADPRTMDDVIRGKRA